MEFREIVRNKQAIPYEECIEILTREKRGVLAVLGDGGYPYAVPLDHYYCPEDGRLYFHSGRTGHKIDAMKRCEKASYCVYGEGTPTDTWALEFKSVIVFGRIEFVEDRKTVAEMSRRLSRKFTDDETYIQEEIDKYLTNTLLFALAPEHITGKHINEA